MLRSYVSEYSQIGQLGTVLNKVCAVPAAGETYNLQFNFKLPGEGEVQFVLLRRGDGRRDE